MSKNNKKKRNILFIIIGLFILIIACVFCTFILYPVSFAGYHWGKKASL